MPEEIVKVSKEIDKEKQNKAEQYHKEVLARSYLTGVNLLELGKLFKAIRDEKLYKLLGASTFKEYCGFPEIPYARTTIYSFIGVYEKYILKFDLPPTTLSKIGHRKLQIISPIVNRADDCGAWTLKAEVLSESDLINEVRVAQGKPEMLPAPKEGSNEKYHKFTKTGWLEFVRNSPCILHQSRNSETSHFPRTKKRGAEWWEVIPLCHECHALSHADTYDFLWLNRVKIFNWFYNILVGEQNGG